MDKVNIILTPVLTMAVVSLIIPWIISIRQRSEQKAMDDKCLCYHRASVNALWILSGVLVLLTLAILVCTILSIIDPEMMDTSADDIAGIVFTWVFCIAVDVFVTIGLIMFVRKITYNSDSFTDIRFHNKKQEYFYRDITKIESTVRIIHVKTGYGVYKERKGKLKIYFGEDCVKIPAYMLGLPEFMAFLQTQCPNLFIY